MAAYQLAFEGSSIVKVYTWPIQLMSAYDLAGNMYRFTNQIGQRTCIDRKQGA
jgi:hypothetical protein